MYDLTSVLGYDMMIAKEVVMDKNTRYAINKGYPVIKIGLTHEEAKQAVDEFEKLAKFHCYEFQMLNLVANLIRFALEQLES